MEPELLGLGSQRYLKGGLFKQNVSPIIKDVLTSSLGQVGVEILGGNWLRSFFLLKRFNFTRIILPLMEAKVAAHIYSS